MSNNIEQIGEAIKGALACGGTEVTIDGERWKIDAVSRNYFASDKGRVWSIACNAPITTRRDRDGYIIFHYFVKGRSTTMRVHRLVASVFLPNPDNLPIVEHLDCDPSNNCVENLKWSTILANNNHPITLQRLSKALKGRPISPLALEKISKPIMQFSMRGEFIKKWLSGSEASRELGINFSKIASCARRERHTAGGYVWRRKVEEDEWIVRGETIRLNIRGKFGNPIIFPDEL